jgi:hypothetical protein
MGKIAVATHDIKDHSGNPIIPLRKNWKERLRSFFLQDDSSEDD